MIEKTEYPNARKVVLSDGRIGIMFSRENYADLSAVLDDQSIFEYMRGGKV